MTGDERNSSNMLEPREYKREMKLSQREVKKNVMKIAEDLLEYRVLIGEE